MTSTTTTRPRSKAGAARPALTLRLLDGGRAAEPMQLSLPLEWEVAPGIPAIPPVSRQLRILGDGGESASLAADLPDIGRWAARMARAVAEVAGGERPPGQLTRWVTRPVLAQLARRGTAVARHPAARQQRGTTRIRSVRSVRICPVAPGIVEASAVLVGAERSRAVAIRFEATAGRWLATEVELI